MRYGPVDMPEVEALADGVDDVEGAVNRSENEEVENEDLGDRRSRSPRRSRSRSPRRRSRSPRSRSPRRSRSPPRRRLVRRSRSPPRRRLVIL